MIFFKKVNLLKEVGTKLQRFITKYQQDKRNLLKNSSNQAAERFDSRYWNI